jgi:hypothetical protein
MILIGVPCGLRRRVGCAVRVVDFCPQARDDTVERGVGVLQIVLRTIFRTAPRRWAVTLLLVWIRVGHPATPLSAFGVSVRS